MLAWNNYFTRLIEDNSSSPEQSLICAAFERLLRDLGFLGSEPTVTFRVLVRACDFVFDEPSGEEPWTLRWMLQHMNGVGDPEKIIRALREYVLDYWTVPKVRSQFCECLRRS